MTVAVRQPGAVAPTRRRRSATLVVAGLLAAVISVGTAAPASAEPIRHQALERFALSLVNCTRTGGWVRDDGTCRGYGSGRVSANRGELRFHQGIADEVAYPWAVIIARAGYCGHELRGSSIDDRFTLAGFGNPYNGESVGCSGYYGARRMIIRTHRMFQRERSSRGWHWRNIKDPDWRSVGIGVTTVGRQTRVVYDFYGGRAPR